MVDPFLPEPEKVAAIRRLLPATGAGIYLNTGSVGPLPAETVRAMREIEDLELRTGRASPAYWTETLERLDEARAVLAAVVAAGPNEVALTHGTTDGVNIALGSLDWQRGDVIVTTDQEHPGVLGPVRAVAERAGVEVRVVPVGDRAEPDVLLERFAAAILPGTRLVVVSHVAWTNGAVLPVEAIGALALEQGAWYVVDGAQSAGALEVDAAATGADFYTISGQKWLLGPEATGGLWVSRRAVAEARQSSAGFLSYESLPFGDDPGRRWPDARRFEASAIHRPSIAGLARTLGWLQMFVGLPWVHERGQRLAARLADALLAVPGVTLLTPRHAMATLVTFRVTGWTAEQAAEELERRVFAIVRTIPPLDAVRASVGAFNTEHELDRFVETVRVIARHTPEDIPRRPSLIVMTMPPTEA
jgi:L-cysteine/cystine lyase